jgi:hypothetical protein
MKMKYITAMFIILIATAVTTAGFVKTKSNGLVTPVKGFAVVELFTSEGCSSCPAADETVARLLSKKIDNVFILSYHVDYWNRLGWKDPFSAAAYSERQSQYSSQFNNSSVYTPQVVVNGTVEFVGSDEEKLRSTVEGDLKKQPVEQLTISTSREDNRISVIYDTHNNNEVFLNIALVQAQASTSVKRGENGGRTLHHVNIVRALKTINANGQGTVEMQLPAELAGIPLEVIGYTQNKNNLEILAANQTSF